jgi:hypothetical protein
MPSTYSPSLKIELIGNGEQAGTWGQTTNNNMGTLIEQAIAGVQPITLTGNYTLTNYNGLSDESRNAVLVFSGSLAAAANVTAPSVQKTYIITNNAGANVTVKTSTGNGVTVQNGLSALIYCDGTDFYTAVNVNNVIGDLSVSGNETVAGYVTVGGALTFANSVTNTSGNLTFTANSSIIDMSTNTKALVPPTGTTAQRPATPRVGMNRWNSDTGAFEVWTGVEWKQLAAGTYNIDFLVVAGGGSGGYGGGTGAYGGGGAGGLIYVTGYGGITPGNSYTITVGSGGATATGSYESNSGSNSSAFSQTAIGGGGGTAKSGGSGGGSNNGAGSGTSGQGNNGGGSVGGGAGGGGGGAGAAGSNQYGGGAGAGGIGLSYDITGTATFYAGGGGGGANADGDNYNSGSGGSGGGGSGANAYPGSAGDGGAATANTGGGGGGGSNVRDGSSSGHAYGGAGGSGVVIIRYASATQRASGGTVTTYTTGSVTYWVHKFTSSGTFVA